MKILRHLGWCRYFLALSLAWIFFMFIVLNFSRHEPDPKTSHKIAKLLKEVQAMKSRDYEKLHLLIEYSPRLGYNEREKFMKRLAQLSKGYGGNSEPSQDYEVLRRRLYSNVMEMWYYITSQATQLKPKFSKNVARMEQYNNFLNMITQYKRSLIKDISSLSDIDGFSEWRRNENEDLSNLVQRTLTSLQNPKNCKTARKLVCDLNKGCGYGCQLHHAVYCFIVAYGTERTLILKSRGWRYSHPGWEKVFLPLSDTCTTIDGTSKTLWPGKTDIQVLTLPIIDSLSPRPPFLPLSIPEDLAPRIIRIHGDPIVWWIGQFLKYLLRPQPDISKMLDAYKRKLGFKKPIVGVHIRRTDKVGTEAAFHKLNEYMTHVEEYYETLALTSTVNKKRVYIATDEPKIFTEARNSYPDYEIIGDESISESAAVKSRYSENSLSGIVTDIHLLSLTDYLVCTFSSQVCRVAYEIMNYLNHDAANRYRSLDDIYYYGGQKGRYQKVVIEHKPLRPEEIELKVGDELSVAGNHWDGFSKGTNLRTFKTGLYPTFKVVAKVETAQFPSYSQLNSID